MAATRSNASAPDGKLKWRDTIENVVATVGKNLALDTFLAGAAYTVTGPYMGLISSTSYSAVAAGDTMASHAGWLEAGGANAPTYTGNRKTAVWSAAASGSKALSAALSFAITGTGTVKGAFLCYGSGALNTKDNTAGTLWSAGTFTHRRQGGGQRRHAQRELLNVAYETRIPLGADHADRCDRAGAWFTQHSAGQPAQSAGT